MKTYYILLIIIGAIFILSSFLPIILKKFKISFTIPLLLLGIFLYYLKAPLPWPDPTWSIKFSLRFAELVVIISLMVAGLKIGVNYSFKNWKKPFRLIGIAMPVFMTIIFLIAYYLLKFDGATALLLAAILAPTDPALASEIQLDKKQESENKDLGVQYTLTSEAGLNDGLAFPFVFLAILWSKQSAFLDIDLWYWFSFYFCYKIIVGIAIGVVLGYVYSYISSKISSKRNDQIHHAFIAISLTLLAYGIAEIAQTYGFLSVFFCGLFAQYHKQKQKADTPSEPNLSFITNIEKLLIIFWTVFFGGSLIAGILNFLTIAFAMFGLLLVLFLRPIIGYLSLAKSTLSIKERWAVSFYGVRGIGSVFYLAFALKNGTFNSTDQLYSIVAFIILLSIIVHGFTARRMLKSLAKNN